MKAWLKKADILDLIVFCAWAVACLMALLERHFHEAFLCGCLTFFAAEIAVLRVTIRERRDSRPTVRITGDVEGFRKAVERAARREQR